MCPNRLEAISQTGGCADARDFYDYLCNRVTVRFIPKSAMNREEETIELDLSRRMTYDRWAAKVGERVGVDPTHIRFYSVNMANGSPKAVVRRAPTSTLQQVLTSPYGAYGGAVRGPTALFYEVLDLSLSELETKKALKVVWLSEGISKEASRFGIEP